MNRLLKYLNFLFIASILISCDSSSFNFRLIDDQYSTELKHTEKELEGTTIDVIENIEGLYTDIHYDKGLLYALNKFDHYAVDVIAVSYTHLTLPTKA